MWDAGLEVVLFQPKQVRAYAAYRNRRAKNDRLDAELIAACAAAVEAPAPPPDPRLAEMARDLLFVEQIESDIARLKTRLEAYRDAPRQTALLAEQIVQLKALLRREIRGLHALIRDHADLARRVAPIESVDGAGPRTALAILIHTPEIGALSREHAAALAGRAPYDADSGFKQRRRRIKGGRDEAGPPPDPDDDGR